MMTATQSLKRTGWLMGLLLLLAAGFSACKKDYYKDSGLQQGKFAGSSFEYLQTKPYYFDTLVTIVQLAGLESVLRDSSVTFFAPTDYSVKVAMNIINAERYNQFQDSLKLQEVPGEVWRKFLSRYIFRDKYMLKDVPRYDPDQRELYPGMNMESWQGYVMNLGVMFSDYNGTHDVGPRSLLLRDIGDLGNPQNVSAQIASSDMQTRNGIVHVLNSDHILGFNPFAFASLVKEYLK